MMQWELAEILLVTSVRLESLIFELFEVDELRLVNDEIVKRHGIRRSGPVLGYDIAHRSIVERYGILPVGRRKDWRFPMEGFPRSLSNDIVEIPLESPPLQVDEHRW